MTEPQEEYTTEQQPAQQVLELPPSQAIRYAVFPQKDSVILYFSRSINNKVVFTISEARKLATQIRQAANEAEKFTRALEEEDKPNQKHNKHRRKGKNNERQTNQDHV